MRRSLSVIRGGSGLRLVGQQGVVGRWRLQSSSSRRRTKQQRIVEVAIVGLPNAGKSTLLNALLARPVAAVSPKRNTTRQNTLGVATDPGSGVQMIFYDTPGFVHAHDSSESGPGVGAPPLSFSLAGLC